MAPGMTPVYASATDLMVDVEAPSGKVLAVDDPALIEMLSAGWTESMPCPFCDRTERSRTADQSRCSQCRP